MQTYYDTTLTTHDHPSHELGYHGTTWVHLGEHGGPRWDPEVPGLLHDFLREVERAAAVSCPDREHGCAYLRVLDGAQPENYMLWHVDNLDGGVRFTTTLATDGACAQLAWLLDPELLDEPVETTYQSAPWVQPPNGTLVEFTTEPHGVLPQVERPGELTVILFATLYKSREAADLYTTNNTATAAHAALPALERSR